MQMIYVIAPDTARTVLVILTGAAALVAGLATLAGFLGRLWWFFELFSHFRLQYLLGLAAAALVFFGLSQPLAGLVAAALAAINLGLILPLYRKPHTGVKPANPGDGKSFRLLLANVLQSNCRFSLMAGAIRDNQPDLVVLVEVNQEWMAALGKVLASYPHRLEEIREDHFGTVLLSRFPIRDCQVHRVEEGAGPVLEAAIALNGQRLTLLAAHPPPPKSPEMAALRNLFFEKIAILAGAQRGPVIAAGDLNSSSWSPFFTRLLDKGRLRDSRRGFGIQASWPAGRFHLQVPIDHVLVSSEIQIHHRRLGPYTGSDHYPVIVDFSIEST